MLLSGTRFARLAIGMAAVSPALSSCAGGHGLAPGVAGDPGSVARVSSAAPAPHVEVDPADKQESVRLDQVIFVRVAGGILQSVTVHRGDDPRRTVLGHLGSSGLSWASAEPLDNHTRYVIDARAVGPDGAITSSVTSFTTLFVTRLVTSMSPGDGDTVGVGMPVSLRFNSAIPSANQAALLQHIAVEAVPPVVGGWHWFSAREVHWRPRDFWPPGTRVTVTAKLRGVEAGGGAWGFGDFNSSFTIGEKHLTVVDVAAHQMMVFQGDQLIDTWPVSAGRPGRDTLGGTLFVPYKTRQVKMDSLTIGIPRNSPDGYYDDVFWNTAISVNGFYIHAAPWDVAQQGVANVSHGCVNLAPDRAQTYFNFSRIGDVVQVQNSPRLADAGDGEGDWQIPFAQWPNSGGAIAATPTHPGGGI